MVLFYTIKQVVGIHSLNGFRTTKIGGTGWEKVKYNGITGYCGYKYLK